MPHFGITAKINSSTLAPPPPSEPAPTTSSAVGASSTPHPALHSHSFAPLADHSANLSAPRPLATAHIEGQQSDGARRQEQPRMRSSIACSRCRRSKVKCVNNGVNTTCRACETSGRECTYPPPATGGAGGARRESMLAGQPGGGSDVSPQGEVSFITLATPYPCPMVESQGPVRASQSVCLFGRPPP